jgi:hypothetical protein
VVPLPFQLSAARRDRRAKSAGALDVRAAIALLFTNIQLPEANGPELVAAAQEQRQLTNRLGEWLNCQVETERTRLCAPSGAR